MLTYPHTTSETRGKPIKLCTIYRSQEAQKTGNGTDGKKGKENEIWSEEKEIIKAGERSKWGKMKKEEEIK